MCIKVNVLLILLATLSRAEVSRLNEILSWNLLEYEFPTDIDRQYAISNGLYKPNTGVLIDVDVHYMHDGSARIFTTMPRFSNGIPFSLATVSDEVGPNGPTIYPYPTYEWHTRKDCFGITSAFRIAIDECDQMWIIDSGLVGGVQLCRPQLLTFDLKTDKLVNRYKFSRDVFTPAISMLITPSVDIRDPPPGGRCQKAMVYIADVNNHGLVVYDSQRNTAWRIENKLMYPDPDWGTHVIAGETFDMMDGIFTINLTPPTRTKIGDERYLYFHALSSDTENAVPLRLIDNQTIWLNDKAAMPSAFRVIGRRGVQAVMGAMDSKGNLFTSTHDPLTLFYWNIDSPYTYDSFKIVATNAEQLQFASGMKVVKHPLGHEELWISTCRYQKIATGSQNPNETNFRILACKIDDLLSKSGCSSMGVKISSNFNRLTW